MNRRRFGVVLMAFAVLLLMTIPGLVGRRVAGTPVRAVEAPPTVGACLAVAVQTSDLSTSPAVDPDGVSRFPVAQFTSCGGEIAGEVVSVYPDSVPPVTLSAPSQAAAPATTSMLGSEGVDQSRCIADVVAYVGAVFGTPVPIGGKESNGTLTFVASPDVRAVQIGPSAAQLADGQRWWACAVQPDRQENYYGSVRRIFSDVPAPSAFGECLGSPPPSQGALIQISCDEPHDVQLLATAQVAGGTAVSDEVAGKACDAIAAAVLKTSDPTWGGLLATATSRMVVTAISASSVVSGSAVNGLPVAPGGAGIPTAGVSQTGVSQTGATQTGGTAAGRTAAGPDGEFAVGCYIADAGYGSLAASLIGWGNYPLPWAQ